MADKLPIKAKFAAGSPVDVIALQEFEPTDTIPLSLISGFSQGVVTELANNSISALIDVDTSGSPSPITGEVLIWDDISGTWKPGISPGSTTATWGLITGTLSNQTDLQTILNNKLNLTGGTLTGQLGTTVGTFLSNVTPVDNTSEAFVFDTSNSFTSTNKSLLTIQDVAVDKFIFKNNPTQNLGQIRIPDTFVSFHDFYIGYSDSPTNYAGMFNNFGDVFLGISTDPTTRINNAKGKTTTIGSIGNLQKVRVYVDSIDGILFLTTGGSFGIKGSTAGPEFFGGGFNYVDNFKTYYGTDRDWYIRNNPTSNDLEIVDSTGTSGNIILDGLKWPNVDGTLNQVLTTDGSGILSFTTIDHNNILNNGTNTHAQIDTHVADTTIHYTQASISITESQISDLGTYESALGNPTLNGQILSSTTAGARSWITYIPGSEYFVTSPTPPGSVPVVTGVNSVAIGGNGQQATGGGSMSLGGVQGIALGAASVAIGGQFNVASGNTSITAGGSGCTASGTNSITAGGSSCTSAGIWSAVVGSLNSSVLSTSSRACVIMGASSSSITAATRYSGIAGGQFNVISGTGYESFIIAGVGNTISSTATANAIVGGIFNRIQGSVTNVAIIGGNNCTTSSTVGINTGIVTGVGANAIFNGNLTIGSGSYVTPGDSQSGVMSIRVQSTDATPAELFFKTAVTITASDYLTLPDNCTLSFSILIVARNVTPGSPVPNESAAYKLEGCIDRYIGASTTALVGSVIKTVIAEDVPAWDVFATADVTNGRLAIKVTGEANKTINWSAQVHYTMVIG